MTDTYTAAHLVKAAAAHGLDVTIEQAEAAQASYNDLPAWALLRVVGLVPMEPEDQGPLNDGVEDLGVKIGVTYSSIANTPIA